MENGKWKACLPTGKMEKRRLREGLGYFMVLLMLLSCGEKPPAKKQVATFDEPKVRDQEKIRYNLKPLPDSLKNGAHSLQGAIQYLEAHNTIEDYVVGNGRKSSVFPAYLILRREADNACLFRLLQSETPAVRVYAFVTLTQRDSTLRDQAWARLKGKKDKVLALSHCDGDIHSVDLLCIAPLDFVENPVEPKEVIVKED